MIKSIHLGNFKAFAETQDIPIKPITLIFGPNSAGKSSIIHSLALVHQADKDGSLDVYRTELGGSSIDLGGFRQYIYRRQVNRRLEFGVTFDTAHFEGRLAENFAPVREVKVSALMGMPLDDEDRPISGSAPSVLSYEIFAHNKTLIRMSRRPDGNLAIDHMDSEHPVISRFLKAMLEAVTTTEKVSPEELKTLAEVVDEMVPTMVFYQAGIYVVGPVESTDEQSDQIKALEFYGKQTVKPISRGERMEDLAAVVRQFLPNLLREIIDGLNQSTSGFLSRLEYLGPLRSYPPRHLAFSEHEDTNWKAGGGYAWDVLRRDERVRASVNQWLSAEDRLKTPYQFEITNLGSIEKILENVKGSLENYHSLLDQKAFYGEVYEDGEPTGENDLVIQLEMVEPEILHGLAKKGIIESGLPGVLEELSMIDKRSNTMVSHRDVGIGISQVVPVLVSAFGSEKKIVAIEQPEIHLHPKLQAELGDVFIESAIGKNQNTFLLETHSEHLILRIMRRIKESKLGKLPENFPMITNENVCVLFVDPEGPASVVREIPLSETGELVGQWPGGFFEESFEELF